MRLSSTLAAVSIFAAWTASAAVAQAPPPNEHIVIKEPLIITPSKPSAGNPDVKPGTVVKIDANDRQAGKEEVYYKITLQEGRSAAEPKRSFEIKDWSFESPSKVDSFTVKQGVKPVGTSDLTMKRGTSPAGGLDMGKDLQARDKMDNAPLDRPTFGEKFSMNGEPRSPGSLRVKVRFPWLGCEEGKRYPAATMEGGGKTYQLTDVTIRGCSASGPTEQITFVYGQMVVK